MFSLSVFSSSGLNKVKTDSEASTYHKWKQVKRSIQLASTQLPRIQLFNVLTHIVIVKLENTQKHPYSDTDENSHRCVVQNVQN